MWGHKDWKGQFFTSDIKPSEQLNQYSQFYTTVEGNTTFYALPSEEKVQHWSEQVPSDFKFCFKVPKTISHEMILNQAQSIEAMQAFLTLLKPIIDTNKLGQLMLQLPASFSARRLGELNDFIQQFAKQVQLSVEVRHPDFFAKQDAERDFNRMLINTQVNRVLMDTRAVHSQAPTTEAIIDAQKKKPKVPVHAIATSASPIIRYVGQTDLNANIAFIQPWIKKVRDWVAEGRTPYLFIHTADNASIHQLSRLWLSLLQQDQEHTLFYDNGFASEKVQQTSLF
ncbi:DUF72 domain-containing protein [Catenovulum sp. SM1970]|uniref:DUF72 domain-containing protein n=1 Tax=Marinifaba aquimaris TaxID=2741323 RepID=UPI001573273A|nr:DUF72 domain-containing protein [Marinifaba aquimaris]NTS77253.1 DUF72 domain-containing protein [Marinifaba aquimaris]